jgi:HK97 family phage prohead protease
MPYHVAKTSKCPADKPWGVIKDSDDSVMGCHPSKAEANKQLAALYANEPKAALTMTIREQRAAAGVPNGMWRAAVPFKSQLRAKLVQRDGRDFYEVTGYATVFNTPYTMYDMFGEYTEKVDSGALNKTLSNSPDVAFLTNHRGLTMARTTNKTLALNKDMTGLHIEALMNAGRTDVRDLASAIGDELITEMSFAFMIDEDGARWNDDYTELTLMELDINRGDVSAVNYGANPYTSIGSRASEIIREVRGLPAGALPAALSAISSAVGEAGDKLGQEALTRFHRAAQEVERATLVRAKRDGLTPDEISEAFPDLDFKNWPVVDETGETDEGLTKEERAARVLRALDTDEDPNALASALDATLDEAINLLEGVDITSLPPDVQQALALVNAAEVASDQLLEVLGLPDPDDVDTLSAPNHEERGYPVDLLARRLTDINITGDSQK